MFVWTPPHFWALAIARKEEYARVDIPMLPVTHGEAFTRLNILLYTILLVLGTIFLVYAIRIMRRPDDVELPMKTFKYSITYLGILFAGLLLDHYFLIQFEL